MRKRLIYGLAAAVMLMAGMPTARACTNFLITGGATVDGSNMITYAADSHGLYGELYHWPAADYPEGAMLEVYEWDTGKYLGKIKQVRHTYNVIGNMNEHSLAIGETTYGGRRELRDPEGIIDYGSLIYITLQRAKTAREAIQTIAGLMDEYGYYSSGESFSIADQEEVWVMELIGKGKGNTGAVWVALRIPDGYISGHANQARITTFPMADGKKSITSKEMDKIFNEEVECVYAYDVVDVARDNGWYKGKDKDFSFSDVYAPVDFGGARFCEARVYSGFNKVKSGMDKYLDYAMGENLDNRMPLWIKPDQKLDVQDVMGLMRDYYQNTPMDMTKDIGAGPYNNMVRWRPMTWSVEGDDNQYFNERAISTQQTAFSFVAQCRPDMPAPIAGVLWFGLDDTYFTVYTPLYCGMTEVPPTLAVGNGDMMTYSETSSFWLFNQVSNFAYTRFRDMIPDVQQVQSGLESHFATAIPAMDQAAVALYKKDKEQAIELITDLSLNAQAKTFKEWKSLYHHLLTRFIDGNIKTKREVPEGYKYVSPGIQQPGYGEEWYKLIIEKTGDKFKVKN